MDAIIILIFVIIGGGAFSRFLYYVIGEPVGEIGNPDGGSVKIGRPLSFYGVFILERYICLEMRENARLGRLFNSWREKSEFMSAADAARAAEKKNIELNRRRRINPYSAAGCCPICFFTWIGAAYWGAAYFALGGFNPFFFLFLIPLNVMIARRIE